MFIRAGCKWLNKPGSSLPSGTANKKEPTIDKCSNLGRPQGHYAWWKKKPTSKGYIQNDSLYITIFRKDKALEIGTD